MKILSLFTFPLLALLLFISRPMCSGAEPAIDSSTVSVHTVHYGTMPFHTLGRIENALLMERGSFDQANVDAVAFRIDPDGKHARRVNVRFGAIASEMIDIKSGLREGDKVIVTDMSRWLDCERIRLD